MARFTVLPVVLCSFLVAGCFSSVVPAGSTSVGVEPFLNDGVVKKKEGIHGPEAEGMLNILTENRTLFRARFETLTADSQPAEVVKAFRGYVAELEKLDAKPCPVEFRATWTRYLKAWRELNNTLGRLPNAYEDVEFLDALQYLFRGNTDKGRKLGGDVMAAVKQVNKSHQQVYAAADNYGIEKSRE